MKTKVPYGFLSGLCAIFSFYLTVAVVVAYIIMGLIDAETQSTAGLFGTWWQTLLFLGAVLFAAGAVALLVVKILSLKKPIKEEVTANE